MCLFLCFQDLYQRSRSELRIHFLDEQTNEESSWHVTMETEDALLSLVNTIKAPWEEQFGVELQVNILAPGQEEATPS